MTLSFFFRNWAIFIFVFPILSQTVDYNHILDDYDRLNGNFLQPDVFRHHKFLYYPRQPILNNHLVPVNIKSLIEFVTNNSIVINGRSPLKISNRWKLNSNLKGNKSQSKQLSDTDSIALADLIVDFLSVLFAGGGVAGISMAAVALLSGWNPKNTLPGVQSQMRSLIQGDFTSCTAASVDSGYCASLINCNLKKGISSGACPNGGVCCTNSLTTCSGTVQYNNTYWQSPTTIYPDSSCVVTVKLDPAIAEQRGPICQLRLDFEKFNIAQPNSESVCSNHVFLVGGTDSVVSPICGENKGQHTPFGCLQYFSFPSGTVNSFNWADTTNNSTRQLANQNYHICFRREIVDASIDTTLCFTPSVTPNSGKAFSLTGSDASVGTAGQAGFSQANLGDCNNDFLIIPNGHDPALSASPANLRDRYCGERLNVLPKSNTSTTVCTKSKPYRIIYNTNSDETVTDSRDAANVGNIGFSLRYYQIKL
ncbi:hypothetical protein DAPPUDRAFT_101194 [Daphnia pulex]|uniref:CUB domain-containing protein n=1 Tax=Daphnia pulex TaxID=6669 RepID=E9GCN4_DAPPU|nr:hypothetical protein DAPPUDRAFT_101194 [Daphnia pulex]|eukprot:EFX82587.1 hypothetical protein DAPPUDRAFT_101194 [Daphnia pulex]